MTAGRQLDAKFVANRADHSLASGAVKREGARSAMGLGRVETLGDIRNAALICFAAKIEPNVEGFSGMPA